MWIVTFFIFWTVVMSMYFGFYIREWTKSSDKKKKPTDWIILGIAVFASAFATLMAVNVLWRERVNQ